MNEFRIIDGDCLAAMRGLEAASVDSVVTDPPYGLSFMGRDWDHGVPGVAYWRAVSDVLRPGGYLLAFGGTRTYHRLACAIEDAGFMIVDSLVWLYGSGFPKHKSKLKPAHELIVMAWKPARQAVPLPGLDGCRVGINETERGRIDTRSGRGLAGEGWGAIGNRSDGERFESHPAGRWPPNVLLSHSPGCRRVGTRRVRTGPKPYVRGVDAVPSVLAGIGRKAGDLTPGYADPDGMETVEAWECVEGCPVKELDRQSGARPASPHGPGVASGTMFKAKSGHPGYRDFYGSGGASRFFPTFAPDSDVPFCYNGKASRSERWFYCRDCREAFPFDVRDSHLHGRRDADGKDDFRHCVGHPTQKPIGLMDWLCRLVTPSGGTILDPFAGSGSTGVAAVAAGFGFVGIDADPEYCAIARRRIAAGIPSSGRVGVADRPSRGQASIDWGPAQ